MYPIYNARDLINMLYDKLTGRVILTHAEDYL
jgi:hypothetical protein